MSTEFRLRASDDDRDRLVEQLQRHAADGRLSLAGRAGHAPEARDHREGARQLIVALLLALLVLAVLRAAVAAFR